MVEIHNGSEARLQVVDDIIINGNSKQYALKGIYEFSDISLIAKPNITKNLKLVSSAISQDIVEHVNGAPFEGMKVFINIFRSYNILDFQRLCNW